MVHRRPAAPPEGSAGRRRRKGEGEDSRAGVDDERLEGRVGVEMLEAEKERRERDDIWDGILRREGRAANGCAATVADAGGGCDDLERRRLVERESEREATGGDKVEGDDVISFCCSSEPLR